MYAFIRLPLSLAISRARVQSKKEIAKLDAVQDAFNAARLAPLFRLFFTVPFAYSRRVTLFIFVSRFYLFHAFLFLISLADCGHERANERTNERTRHHDQHIAPRAPLPRFMPFVSQRRVLCRRLKTSAVASERASTSSTTGKMTLRW